MSRAVRRSETVQASAAILAAALVAGAGLSAAPGGQGAPGVFRAGAEAVSVDVAVRRGGRPVTGLTAPEFEILDNGVPQTIVDVSYERLPIDVTVAFDVSASVTAPILDQLQRAMRQLRLDLRPADRLRLLTFNNRISRLVDITDPPAEIDRAFERIRTSGSSAVFDALAVALTVPVAADRRYLVVAFSDGQDTSSILPPSVLLDVVRRTTPVVYAVLPTVLRAGDRPLSGPAEVTGIMPGVTPLQGAAVFASGISRPVLSGLDASREIFSALAREAGGLTITAAPGENLSTSFRRVLDEFRSTYVLHFVPAGVDPGGLHQLTVRVKRDNVEVRARRNYTRR